MYWGKGITKVSEWGKEQSTKRKAKKRPEDLDLP
jgi:hypothetical protein